MGIVFGSVVAFKSDIVCFYFPLCIIAISNNLHLNIINFSRNRGFPLKILLGTRGFFYRCLRFFDKFCFNVFFPHHYLLYYIIICNKKKTKKQNKTKKPTKKQTNKKTKTTTNKQTNKQNKTHTHTKKNKETNIHTNKQSLVSVCSVTKY